MPVSLLPGWYAYSRVPRKHVNSLSCLEVRFHPRLLGNLTSYFLLSGWYAYLCILTQFTPSQNSAIPFTARLSGPRTCSQLLHFQSPARSSSVKVVLWSTSIQSLMLPIQRHLPCGGPLQMSCLEGWRLERLSAIHVAKKWMSSRSRTCWTPFNATSTYALVPMVSGIRHAMAGCILCSRRLCRGSHH